MVKHAVVWRLKVLLAVTVLRIPQFLKETGKLVP